MTIESENIHETVMKRLIDHILLSLFLLYFSNYNVFISLKYIILYFSYYI